MNNILMKQDKIAKDLSIKYDNGEYNLKNPFIVLNPYGVCPLSALMRFKLETKAKVTVNINELVIEFDTYKNEYFIQILGLLPDTDNKIKVMIFDVDGNKSEVEHIIKTEKLPEEYPNIELTTCKKEFISDNFISMYLGQSDGVKTVKHLYSIIDREARVRWLYTGVAAHMFKKLKNGNLIVDAPISSGICGAYTAAGFIEMDFLGKIIKYYYIPNGLHHDVIELPNGNFIAINQRENTKQDLMVEIDRETTEVIREWDFREILDFNRQTVIDKVSVNHPLDWLHLNSMVYEEETNSLIASGRNQSAVVKFNLDTKEIKWILAPHDNWSEKHNKYLLNPTGENFEWSWAQHTPVLTNNGTLLLFDNGNYRSYNIENAILAYKNYSRGVEYKIDEKNMTIEQTWQYGKERGSELYCAYLGSISLLANGNRLMSFGGITKDIFGNPIDDMKSNRMKNRSVIVETKNNEVVFEVKMIDSDITTANGYKCYRADEINLY